MRIRGEGQVPPQGDEQTVRPEGFAGRNIRVITFAICIALFLLFCGPFSFFRIRDCADQRHAEKMPELSVSDMIAFAQDPTLITMKRLCEYRGTYNAGDKGNTFTAQFAGYLLLAFEDPATGMMTYCQVTELQSGAQIDLMDQTVDAAAFFKRND